MKLLIGSAVFLPHGIFIIAQGYEPRPFGPFRKFDLCYELWADPLNLRHYFCGYGFPAARAFIKRTLLQLINTSVDFITLANDDKWLITAGNHGDVGIFDRGTGSLVCYMQT